MRKQFFNNEESGYYKVEQRAASNPMQAMGGVLCVFQLHFSSNRGSLLISLLDPNMAFEMMKGTFTNVLPMIVIGGWINWTFAGFITSEWSKLCCLLLHLFRRERFVLFLTPCDLTPCDLTPFNLTPCDLTPAT